MSQAKHPDEKTGAGASRSARVGQWGFAPFFVTPMGGGRAAATPVELWISLFPTAPLFGLRWFFADMADVLTPTPPGAEPAPTPMQRPDSSAPRAARERARLNDTKVREPAPAPAPAETYEEPSVSLDEIGVGAISDLTALGGVAAAFSSDLGEERGASAERERRALSVTRLAQPAQKLKKPAEAKPAPEKPAAEKPAAEAQAEQAAKPAAKKSAPKKEAARKSAAKETAEATGAQPARKSAPTKNNAPAKAAAPAKPSKPRAPAPKKKAGQPFPTYDAAPPQADDLTKIKGVGEKLAAVLNDRGVYTFEQIAGFDAAAYQWLDQTLGAFKGRGVRDDWAGQAKALMKQ